MVAKSRSALAIVKAAFSPGLGFGDVWFAQTITHLLVVVLTTEVRY